MKQAVEKEAPKLVIRKIIHAKRERVFEAWTKPELLQRWLVPPPDWTARASNELKIGGKYCVEMIVGDTGAGSCPTDGIKSGQILPHTGEYLEITPPERLVFTWNSHVVQNTRVTIELKDLGEETELWLTHELISDDSARGGHNQGWEAALGKMEKLFVS